MAYWEQRISNANQFYNQWAEKFKVKRLREYYENFQWKGRREFIEVNYNPYVANVIYSTIAGKLSSLLFQKPAYLLNPRPGNSQWSPDFAAQSAEDKQDVLNTIVQNPNANFTKQVKLVTRDSFLSYGIIEVGYAADWRNPLKEDPLLSDHGEDSEDRPRVVSDNLVPNNERLYFKRVPPKRFRVAVSDAIMLSDHEWIGYYDFYYTKFLRKTKGIKMPTDYQNALVSADMTDTGLYAGRAGGDRPEFLRLLAEGEISKVWHIWDMIEKKRLMLLDDNFEEIWSGDCDRPSLIPLIWDERDEGFYPVPPAFRWLSPQDEINESREQMRSFRRRFTRKYYSLKGKVDPLEIEKFTSGPDGVVIEVQDIQAIGEISNSPINPVTLESMQISKDDLNAVAGVSAQQQQQPDRATATASKIADARATQRESAEQLDYSMFMSLIGRETLTIAKENLVEGMWVKYTKNPGETILTDMQRKAVFRYITTQQLDDGYDFDIDVDVMNQTPAAMQAQQQSFVQFQQMMMQFPALMMSPILIRKAAAVCGVHDENVIRETQQAAALAMAAKTAQQAAQKGQTLSQATGQGAQPSTQQQQMQVPGAEQVQTQIENQLPVQ